MALHRPKINGSVLKWAREQTLLTLEGAARVAGIDSEERYTAIEEGESYPTTHQLHKLAKELGRPVWFFHLPEVPDDETPPLAAFRRRPMAPSRAAHDEYKAVMEAERRRQIALETLEEIEEAPPRFSLRLAMMVDPAETAIMARNVLGLSDDAYREFRSPEDAYLNLRVAIEAAGVLVFHFSLPSISGFAVANEVLPIIGLSTSERAGAGRQFTLAHELGHIILGDSTIHAIDAPFWRDAHAVERWCNTFAGALLVPESALAAHPLVREYGASAPWSIDDIRALAFTLKVSPSMVARRLDETGRLHPETASHVIPTIDELSAKWDRPREKKAEEDDGPKFWMMTLSAWGYYLPELLLRGFRDGAISEVELTDITGFRSSTSLTFMERVSQRTRSAFAQ